MNATKETSLLLLIMLLIFTSCGKKDDDTNLVINIEDEFNVLLLEELTAGPNKLLVHIRTKETLDCVNYELGHSVAVGTDKMVISIDDLELEGDCISGDRFANTDIPIGIPQDGQYQIQINLSLNSITNIGKLTVLEDSYKVKMETAYGITLVSSSLKRIPDNQFWGYFQLINSDASHIRDNFYEDLTDYASPSNLGDGEYGYFDIENGFAKINPIPLDLYATPPGSFLFQLDGDKNELLQMVKDYQTINAGKIKIVLYTSEGEVL